MTILDTLVEVKKKALKNFPEHVEVIKREKPVDFVNVLKTQDDIALIAEVKRASPSKGEINSTMNPIEQAQSYVEGGADAISVLTEREYFKGTYNDMYEISKVIQKPILNKDFVIDKRQIATAYNNGADIILLIVTILDDARLQGLYDYAKSLDLSVIVEVHDETELKRALKISPEIIGINNRDLKTFKVDINNSKNLIAKSGRKDIHFIAESGIQNGKDSSAMLVAGARGILVGESLMKADNIVDKVEELKGGKLRES
ncbi:MULTISPECIES: indole-3-glycerol phosphate synthase TrpC [Jeotgalicoccus]|uniref:indole-3-glycerol phosphate synthase TrpC n=1 Tax=Jeotgalicoccus TaxID=227979 RepID=UPI000417CE84|nr:MULTISPECIES: indole-3-glycerol phosphate synthase TrpC [Jeotgalicoccus]QQD85940.1 indole-3-glycerol phosphate synthase TrpC [Jeotgalicoccus sp. ATCC 8456]